MFLYKKNKLTYFSCIQKIGYSNLGAYCSVKMFNTFKLYENVRIVLLILGEFSVVPFLQFTGWFVIICNEFCL
jgi:hypothetical protein